MSLTSGTHCDSVVIDATEDESYLDGRRQVGGPGKGYSNQSVVQLIEEVKGYFSDENIQVSEK